MKARLSLLAAAALPFAPCAPASAKIVATSAIASVEIPHAPGGAISVK